MPVYQAWCRPHGCPDASATMSFLIDRVDYRTAWQDAMALCFSGGTVTDPEGGRYRLDPRRWTVQKLKLFDLVEDESEESDEESDLAPSKAMLDPDVRERELARLYAGRRYDNVRFRQYPAQRMFG
jgi:hypothetical protein